jgi:hypothetical protein
MGLWSKISGTIASVWQIGLAGPQLKNNAGNIDARNAADSAFVNVRVATAVGANDAVPLSQLGGLVAPVTVPTVTNSASTVYTVDVTSGVANYLTNHNKSGPVSYVMPAPTLGRELVWEDLTGAIQTAANNVFFVPHGAESFNGSSGYVLTGGATFHVTNGSPTVTATGSAFTNELAEGMSITFSAQPGVSYIVLSVGSALSLTLTTNYGGTTSTTSTATRNSLTWGANFSRITFYSPDGTNWTAKGDGTPTKVSLTANGTFIAVQGVTLYQVTGAGGGGGSGGSGFGGTGANQLNASAGGAGSVERTYTVTLTPSTGYAVVIGAGGAGGAAALSSGTVGTPGSPGVASTFGSLLTFLGGSGGGGSGGAGLNNFGAGGNPYTIDTGGTTASNCYNGIAASQQGTASAAAAIGNFGQPGTGGNGVGATTSAQAGSKGFSQGNFTGGTAGTGGASGGGNIGAPGAGGGGAGPRGNGGNGANGANGVTSGVGNVGVTGTSGAANTGAGGGGSSSGSNGSTGSVSGNNGASGGSGYTDVVYVL